MKSERTSIIKSQICNVCRNLRTRHTSKKHGGYDIYEDEKVVASLDTYVSNCRLSIKVNGELVTVFSCNYLGDVYIYHQGSWEAYLEKLHEEAKIAKTESEKAQAEINEHKHAESFGPATEAMEAVFADDKSLHEQYGPNAPKVLQDSMKSGIKFPDCFHVIDNGSSYTIDYEGLPMQVPLYAAREVAKALNLYFVEPAMAE